MKTYFEAIETGEGEDKDFIKVELSPQASEQATWALINAQMKQGKNYKKRKHYCNQVTNNPCENKPCTVEEIQ